MEGGIFESVGGFFEGVITAGRDYLVARETTAQQIAQQQAAVQAATAQTSFDFKKYQLLALVVVGVGVLAYAMKRG